MLAERAVGRRPAILRVGGAEMPRQRPRRRRRRAASTAPQPEVRVDESRMDRVQSNRRWWLPTAGVVTGTGLGIWIGAAFTDVGGVVAQAILWIGVLMAGLGGGRLFRRSLQRRRDRER